jgi:type VI secretion system protein ImpK
MPIFKMLGQMEYSCGSQLRALLHQFECKAYEHHIPSHQVHDAKYALAALIDETILRSPHADKDNWISQLIQVEQFGEHMAGENFFKWLDRVKSNGPEYLPVLEVYYVCLKMGFQGRYTVEGQEKLNAIHVDVKHTIDLCLGSVNPYLSRPLESRQSSENSRRHFPWWGYSAGSFVCILIFYIGYSMVLNSVVSS